jgi:hypothetical protein
MPKQTAKKQKRPLTLHELVVALSFWGTAVRTLIFGFIAAAVFVAALSEITTSAAIDNEVQVLIYVLGSYLLLDFGYVTVARTYRLQSTLDIVALIAADIFLALLYIAPKIVVDSNIRLTADPLVYVIFVPLVVLGLRMLLGLLFGKRR